MPVRRFAGDKIFTIDPPSPAIIAGIECFIFKKGRSQIHRELAIPRWLAHKYLAHDAAVASTTFPVSTMPTWFATMSIRPKLSRLARKSHKGGELAPSVHLIPENGSMDTPVSAEPPSSYAGCRI
jgi:hypothetical protein